MGEAGMKICQYPGCGGCGLQHPDDVTTSHHPKGCTCGSTLCGGCIWMRTAKIAPGLSPEAREASILLDYLTLIMEREKAGQKQVEAGRIGPERPE